MVGTPVAGFHSGPARTVAVTVGTKILVAAGVAAAATGALESLLPDHGGAGGRLAGAGRYGRLWWIAVDGGGMDATCPVVVVASRLTVSDAAAGGGTSAAAVATPLNA